MPTCPECHKEIEISPGKAHFCVANNKRLKAEAVQKLNLLGSTEFAGSATPSDEVENLRQTIRVALHWLGEYINDADHATHAKRILANAKYEFDGK